MSEFAQLDATAQAELVSSGKAHPRELAEAAIERIERINPEINAVISPLFDRGLALADSKELPDGPFRGVPFLFKDLDATTEGEPFHGGMRFLKRIDWHEDHDSYLAAKFKAAGLVSLGKTNTPELGVMVTTEPKSYGPSRNPWNTGHSTGGSSGGSAAAVAAGMVPVAHASDGGGSIRIPASECGLVGLKPSRGRISLGPDRNDYWAGCVTSHVVSRSVRDSAAILDCIHGPMPGDPYAAPAPRGPYADEVTGRPGRLRVGFMTALPGGGELNGECRRAVEETAALMAELGHETEQAHPPAFDEGEEFQAAFMTVVTSWTASAIGELEARTGQTIGADELEPGTAFFAEMGRGISAVEYVDRIKWLGGYTRRMGAWWGSGYDLLITPTLAGPPPEIGELIPDENDPAGKSDKILSLIPYTPAFNATGQPAISLPLAVWENSGLPLGIQLVGDYGREDLLLGVSAQLEEARPWADRRPALFG